MDLKSFLILLFCLYFSFLSTPLISQNNLAKLDTLKPSLWLSSHNTRQNSDELPTGYINNYQLINREELKSQLQNNAGTMRSNTLFLVLVPKFENPEGAEFLQGSNLSISDEGVTTHGMFNPLIYKIGQPTIITLKVKPTYKYGRVQNSQQLLSLVNEEIFDVAEIMVYDDLLSAEETRYIETYLALKYSVNISNNKVADKRNYLSDRGYYWLSPVEARFNEHILGLGRNDELNFYQTQTFTTDGSNYRLTFDLNQPIGFEADGMAIEDQSHIIFSKTRGLGLGSDCGEVTTQSGFSQWKFKLMNWPNAQPYIYLCIRQSADESSLPDSVVVTNGYEEFAIPVMQNEHYNYLQIPLVNVKNDLHYYIRNATERNDCPNQFLTIQHTDSTAIYIDSPNEPLNLTLVM